MTKPIKKWRISNMEICVWDNKKKFNEGEVSFKTVTLTRSYKKKDEDVWRSEIINNIRRNDISKIQVLLNKVQDYLYFEALEHEKEEEE
jgi:hypothetical protein